MAKHLIVNADDLGYTDGVTSGIVRAHQEGIVTSTSIMVNMPGAASAIQKVQRSAPRLGLGLHLTITAGPPCANPDQVPDLVDAQGMLRGKAEIIPALSQIDITQIEHECRTQIERFIHLVGRPPDHLDSHHHALYLSPPTVSLLAQLARELGIPIRRPIPAEPTNAVTLLLNLGLADDEEAAAKAIHALNNLVAEAGIATPDSFIADFYGERATLGDLLNILVGLPEGTTELMCHPGEVDDQLRAASGYTVRRADELAALTHPSARELIAAEGIELVSFEALR